VKGSRDLVLEFWNSSISRKLFAPLLIPALVHDSLFSHTECNAFGR